MFKNHYRGHRWESATERKYRLIAEAVPAGYKLGKNVSGKSIKAGMKLIAYYNSFNEGVDVVEILGVTGSEQKYGEGGPKFQSVVECLQAYNFKTLKEMDDGQDIPEYGHHSYLYCRDMTWEPDSKYPECGPWYYLFKGRWSRGSGAEALSFIELVEAEKPVEFSFPENSRFNLGIEE